MGNKILGIDLGTTNSCMATVEAGETTVIPNAEGARTTPSIVAFTPSGENLVGQAAKRQAVTNPKNTIFSAKRLIGRKYSEVKDDVKNLPYKVVEGKNGDVAIEVTVNGKTERYAPEQISSMVLAKLKADAEKFLGEPVTQAVITVPAYFNDAQRQATKDAGKIAGLEVLRIINEPTAASLAYGLDKKNEETVAVYDLGGGTFDISVLEIGDGVFEVKATNGDTQLGGDNWDEAIIDWLADTFKKENGIDLRVDAMAMQRLKEESEKAKIALSSTQTYDINLPFITADASGPKHLNIQLTRSKFEQLTAELAKRTVPPVKACLKDAGKSASDVDELVLVGGMTRCPSIVEIAKSIINKDPHQGVNPDEVVAAGAAIQGAVLSGDQKDVLLLDVTPLTLGIETAGGVCTPMIARNTTIPAKKTETFSTYEDNQTAVDIKVLQGERPMADDNKLLGNFRLDGIAPAARGQAQIEVVFDIDANGILHVSAKDKGTGKEQNISITNSSGLSEEEVEVLKKEAEAHAAEDAKRKEAAELRNRLDSAIYDLEKLKEENVGTIGSDLAQQIDDSVKAARSTLENTASTADEFKSKVESLQQLAQKCADAVASSSAADANVSGSEGAANHDAMDPNSNDDAIDADFEVVDDEKK